MSDNVKLTPLQRQLLTRVKDNQPVPAFAICQEPNSDNTSSALRRMERRGLVSAKRATFGTDWSITEAGLAALAMRIFLLCIAFIVIGTSTAEARPRCGKGLFYRPSIGTCARSVPRLYVSRRYYRARYTRLREAPRPIERKAVKAPSLGLANEPLHPRSLHPLPRWDGNPIYRP